MDDKPSLQTMEEEAKIAMTRLKQIQVNEGWVSFGDNPCKMFKMDVDGRTAAKGQAIVNFSFQDVVAFLSDILTLKKLNSQINSIKVLQEYSETIKVNHQGYDGIWPVAGRDIVILTTRENANENKVYMASKSCQFPVPQTKGIVRAEVFIAGYIIERIEQTKTKVTYISDTDVKGSIPGMIKNQLSKRQGSVAGNIEPIMKKQMKK